MPCEHRLRNQCRQRGTADSSSSFVDEEHAVRIAVEREADVSPADAHLLAQIDEVLGLDRVSRVVRKRAVKLAIHQLPFEGQRVEDGRHDESPHAICGICHDAQRSQRRDINE